MRSARVPPSARAPNGEVAAIDVVEKNGKPKQNQHIDQSAGKLGGVCRIAVAHEKRCPILHESGIRRILDKNMGKRWCLSFEAEAPPRRLPFPLRRQHDCSRGKRAAAIRNQGHTVGANRYDREWTLVVRDTVRRQSDRDNIPLCVSFRISLGIRHLGPFHVSSRGPGGNQPIISGDVLIQRWRWSGHMTTGFAIPRSSDCAKIRLRRKSCAKSP